MSERDFVASLAAPGEARQFATQVLGNLVGSPVPRALLDDVQLVVSELVTNAVRAGSPIVHLDISLSAEGRVALRVTDAADGWPHPREATVEDPGGRGLALVSAVAATWGARLDADTKTVWAELSVPG